LTTASPAGNGGTSHAPSGEGRHGQGARGLNGGYGGYGGGYINNGAAGNGVGAQSNVAPGGGANDAAAADDYNRKQDARRANLNPAATIKNYGTAHKHKSRKKS
jgi:hypothetical protein